MKTLEELNSDVIDKIEKIISKNISHKSIKIEDLQKVEKLAMKICNKEFSEFFNIDLTSYINLSVKLSIIDAIIGIYPNNLFTALVMKNRINNDDVNIESIEKINNNNRYHIEDKTISFDKDLNSIYYINVH